MFKEEQGFNYRTKFKVVAKAFPPYYIAVNNSRILRSEMYHTYHKDVCEKIQGNDLSVDVYSTQIDVYLTLKSSILYRIDFDSI